MPGYKQAARERRWSSQAPDVDRPFVADHSALPNALGGQNPTDTGQALAPRTADHAHEHLLDSYLGSIPGFRSAPFRTARMVSPDEAFALLGNETRLEIVRALGENGTLSFSDLHDRVDVRDSGQFNYHLERLCDHFVAKSDEGYRLRRAGRRVVEAILSGAVTATPGFDRTQVDSTCRHCGAPIEVVWRSGSVEMYCTECAGTYGRRGGPDEMAGEGGYLGRAPLPPAGLKDRDADEVLGAAWTWSGLELLGMSAGICPRCSATVERDVSVCEDHDAADGLCEACNALHRVRVHVGCTNCIYRGGGDFVIHLLANTDVLGFLADHDLNPVSPTPGDSLHRSLGDYDETVHAVEPFRAEFTLTAEGEACTVTVDDDLGVVDVDRHPA